MMSAYEVEIAVQRMELAALGRHVAEMALDSARINGASPAREYVEAAERVDELGMGRNPRLHEIMGCDALCMLDGDDAKRVAKMAIAVLEGRA